jgi:hypothetical protein
MVGLEENSMLHLLYILAFTIIACIAVSNMIRNLIVLSMDMDRHSATRSSIANRRNSYLSSHSVPHPELLDPTGKVIKAPLLVMRSVNVEDAREHLDALYEASPGYKVDSQEEA